MVAEARSAKSAVRSRKLDEEREQAILRACYDLLGEAGYQGLRVDAVATRAQCSKATLYRHWPTKPGLVLDAIRVCKPHDAVPPDTGTLRGDLVAWLSEVAEAISGEEGPIMAGLFVAMHNEPELAAELRAMRETKKPHAENICARAMARGELRPGYDPDLIDEVVVPMVFMRCFALGEPIDEPYIDHVVDDIVLPLLTRCPAPDKPRP